MIFYEDVEVGDHLPEMVKEPVSHIQLVRYSGASGDFNPIHTVPDIAQMVGLPGIIAHGMLIMAFGGQMLTGWVDPVQLRRYKARFSSMTRPAEYLVVRGSVTGKEIVDGEGLVYGKMTVKGRDDDSLKVKGEFVVALPVRNK